MLKVEFERLKPLIGELISINAFIPCDIKKNIGNIRECNAFSPENKVFFMPWSIFHSVDVL